MSGTIVGGAVVEIMMDVGKFADEARAKIAESLGSPQVRETVTAGLDKAAVGAAEAGKTAGKANVDGMVVGIDEGRGKVAAATRSVAGSGEAESAFGNLGKKSAEKFGEQAKSTFSSLSGSIFAGAGIALGLGEVVSKSLEAADGLEAANIKIEGSFGASSDSVKQWAGTMATQLGQSQMDAENTAGTFGQMFHAMGVGQSEAAGMAEKLDTLTQNVAKFNNVDPATVQAAFTAAMRGRGKALAQLGINLDATTISAEAVRHGLVKMSVDQVAVSAKQDAYNAAVAAQITVDKKAASTGAERKAALDKVSAAHDALTKAMGGTLPTLTASQKGEASYYAILDGTKNQQNAVKDSTNTLAQQKKILGAEVANLEAKLGTLLLPMLTKVSKFVTGDVIPAISTFGHWIQQNKAWIEPLVAVLLGVFAAFKIGTIVMDAFNTVMDANPVMLVVIAIAALAAGFIYAYTHSKTFRDIVQETWTVIKKVVLGVWNDALKPTFNALVTAWQHVWSFMQAAWNTVGRPLFDAIKIFINIEIAILKGVFLVLVVSFGLIWALMKTAWTTVGQPLFALISAAVSLWWNLVVKPTFAAVSAGFGLMLKAIQLWWSAIGKPTIDIVEAGFKLLGSGLAWAYDHVIKPTADLIGKVFTTLKAGWDLLWQGIGKVGSAVATPIKTAFNALIGILNDVITGLDKISVSVPSWSPIDGGKKFGINIPHIPTLAEGATVLPRPGGTLAILGEGGKAETVVDTGEMNQLLGAINSQIANRPATPTAQPIEIHEHVYQQPGQDPASMAADISRRTARQIRLAA